MSETTRTPERGGVRNACPCSVDKIVSDNIVTTLITNGFAQKVIPNGLYYDLIIVQITDDP